MKLNTPLKKVGKKESLPHLPRHGLPCPWVQEEEVSMCRNVGSCHYKFRREKKKTIEKRPHYKDTQAACINCVTAIEENSEY